MHNNTPLKVTAIAPLEAKSSCLLPLAESLISAGFPSMAENFNQKTLDLNELLITHPAATFFVRVIGTSMIGAGIQSNDILIVDRALPVTNNAIAVVRINDEFTVKRISIEGTRVLLLAENPEYKAQEIHNDIDFEVWGIVTFVIHAVQK